jgi:hypothetical protein
MPTALKRIFEKEYGIPIGDGVFYSLENKRKSALKAKKKRWLLVFSH